MAEYLSIEVSVHDVTASFAAAAIVDKIWDVDDINHIASAMVSEAQDEEREENLEKLCKEILARLSSTED